MTKKRFTDINIWDREWFMDLTPKYKCLIKYLFDVCDGAGVWVPNWKLASFHIGEKVTEEDLKTLPSDQYQILDGGKIFLPDFISFQYGQLSESSPAHKPVFESIKKHKIENMVFDRVSTRVSITLQEKDIDIDKDKDKEKEITKGGLGEKLVVPKMLSVWKKELPSYKIIQDRDSEALREIAVFISGKNGLEHLEDQESKNLMETWGKWCRHIRGTPNLVKKSLATIAKFNLQDIDQQLKTPLNGTHKHNNSKPIPQTVTNGGFGKL